MRPTLTAAPALALLAALAPAAASAQQLPGMTCTFPSECLDDDCSPSGYEADLRLKPLGIDAGVATLTATIEDLSERVELQGKDQNGLMRLYDIDSANGARLLTVWPDGTARYTTHIADPASSITYVGRCEENR
jgi:hypothetical protein